MGGPYEFITHSSWMRDIPDNAPMTTLSVPGTHDSCCVDGPLGFGQTQDLDLSVQLVAGVRFLDIRLAHYRDNLFVHHDVLHVGKRYKDVLDVCTDFLERWPSETILLSVKDEGRFDSALGKFAPSEVLGKSRGDRANWVVRSNSFEDAFKARTWECVDDSRLFHNFAAPSPDGVPVDGHREFTPATTMGEVRGKIVLLRRFQCTENIGLDLTHWPENERFRSESTLVYDVEDRYDDPGEDEKYDFVVDHMEEARLGDPKDLYITFSSAVHLKPSRYSRAINKRLSNYLAKSPPGRVGIVVMDYFERPQDLVSNVISTNFAADATAGTRGSRYRHADHRSG